MVKSLPLDRNGGKKKIPGQFKDLKVLLAEDYAVNRDLIRYHLEGTGCMIVTADNGLDAVKLFREVKPDLVLMDIQMPELDGLGATRLIRNEEGGHSVCIIGVTANAFPQDLKKYWKAGMNDCLVKPFRKQDLFDKISHWEKFSRMNWGMNGEVLTDIPEENPFVFEPRTLMNRVDNDSEMARILLEGFREESRKSLALFAGPLNDVKEEEIHRHAHSIKSGSLNIGAQRLAEAAEILERAAKNTWPHLYPDAIEAVQREYASWQESADAWENSLKSIPS